MERLRLSTYFIILILSACNAFTSEQESPDTLNKVDALFANIDNSESPGAAVLIVQDGKVILNKGYGMANLEFNIPITSTTIFDIASVSKQFTGFAISLLIEQGKISLEDDIRQYIPELPDFGHIITIGHLIHHTSGLRDWPGTLSLAGLRMDDVISFSQILTMTFNQKELNFLPGAEYSYSNTGYNLLAELVQRVTGESFREWTDMNIFQPLGMTDTHFHDDHTEIVPNRAYGYFHGGDNMFHADPNNLTALGSSSLYTTIDDLAKWVMNLDNPKVGERSAIDRMLQQGILNNGEQISYAFGLSIDDYQGIKRISHSGGWASFSTYLAYFPEYNFSVVVLNNYPTNTYETAHDIADIYLADELKPQNSENDQDEQIAETVNVPIQVLDEYIGTYRLGPAWYVTISRDGDQLMTCATNEDIFPMTATSDSTFWVEAYGSSIEFNRNASHQVSNFYYRGMTCPKLKGISKPIAEQLADFTGEYMSEELKTSYKVAIEGNQLVLKHDRHGTINLIHAWNDEFRGGIWFMNAVEFYRDKEGKVSGFLVTNSRSRNQRFVKI